MNTKTTIALLFLLVGVSLLFGGNVLYGLEGDNQLPQSPDKSASLSAVKSSSADSSVPVLEGFNKIEGARPVSLDEITKSGLILAFKWWYSEDSAGGPAKLYLLVVKAEPRFSDPYEYYFTPSEGTDTLKIYESLGKDAGLALRYEYSGYFSSLTDFISTPSQDADVEVANIMCGFNCSLATANVLYFALTRRGDSLECIWKAILKYTPEFVLIDDDEVQELVVIADGIFIRHGKFSDPDSVLEEQPRDADIYRWNGKYFDIWKSVKWLDRLKATPSLQGGDVPAP